MQNIIRHILQLFKIILFLFTLKQFIMKKIFTLIAVAMLALAAQAENLTVCEGEYSSGVIPVYGLWYDTPGMSQMIYPADSLTEMAGGEITELTFYTLANVQMEGQDFSSYVINF